MTGSVESIGRRFGEWCFAKGSVDAIDDIWKKKEEPYAIGYRLDQCSKKKEPSMNIGHDHCQCWFQTGRYTVNRWDRNKQWHDASPRWSAFGSRFDTETIKPTVIYLVVRYAHRTHTRETFQSVWISVEVKRRDGDETNRVLSRRNERFEIVRRIATLWRRMMALCAVTTL